jgi:hypothetical protein
MRFEPTNICVDENGLQWIPASEAVCMIPSARAGKRTHISTLVRMRLAARIEGAQRPDFGRGWWYRLDQIRALSRVQRRTGP